MTTTMRCPNPECKKEFMIDLTGNETIARGKRCQFCGELIVFREVNGRILIHDFVPKQ